MTTREPGDGEPTTLGRPTPAQMQVYLEVSADPGADLDSLHDLILRHGLSVLDYKSRETEAANSAEAEARRHGFPRYLAALTRRRAIDRYRAQVRAGVSDNVPDTVAYEDPADAVLLQAEVLVLISALEQLTPKDRSLLTARAAGTTLAEVARQESISQAAIRKRYQRAVERLRRVVESIDSSMLGPLPEDSEPS